MYLVQGEADLRTTKPAIQPPLRNAFLDSRNTIQIQFPCSLDEEMSKKILKITQVKNPVGQKITIKDISINDNKLEASIILKEDLGIENKELYEYEVYIKGFKEVRLQPRGILFQQEIHYQRKWGS